MNNYHPNARKKMINFLNIENLTNMQKSTILNLVMNQNNKSYRDAEMYIKHVFPVENNWKRKNILNKLNKLRNGKNS